MVFAVLRMAPSAPGAKMGAATGAGGADGMVIERAVARVGRSWEKGNDLPWPF